MLWYSCAQFSVSSQNLNVQKVRNSTEYRETFLLFKYPRINVILMDILLAILVHMTVFLFTICCALAYILTICIPSISGTSTRKRGNHVESYKKPRSYISNGFKGMHQLYYYSRNPMLTYG